MRADEILWVESGAAGVFIRVGPILAGGVPAFEMHEQTIFDGIKKLFFARDHRVFRNQALDDRFFIDQYPGHLFAPLGDEILAMILALPVGSSLQCDGQILTLALPSGSPTADGLIIAKALGAVGQDKLAFFESIPGVEKQPRHDWAQCPDPQFVIVRSTGTIEIRVTWYGPETLRSTNSQALPHGILSIANQELVPYNDAAIPLLQSVKRLGVHDLAEALGPLTSFYSSDEEVRLSLYSELSPQRVNAAVELLMRVTVSDNGPFR